MALHTVKARCRFTLSDADTAILPVQELVDVLLDVEADDKGREGASANGYLNSLAYAYSWGSWGLIVEN